VALKEIQRNQLGQCRTREVALLRFCLQQRAKFSDAGTIDAINNMAIHSGP
jgi:hypothetical protein